VYSLPLQTGVVGFDGNEVITTVDYNARGAKVAEHQPISTGAGAGSWNGTQASPYMTQYSGIDPLGRVTMKTVVRTSAADFFEPGKGSANLVTNYAYAAVTGGIQTTITVFTPTASSGQIVMSRTYDPRGKLVQTVQRISSPEGSQITTSYTYDPAGDLLTITDSGGNQLTAVYDDLGRKIEVDDPDRGIWFYTWDGLGRVRTQKDARGIALAYQYDAIGRMERRFMLPAGQATWLLEANWQYDLNGKMGTLGAMLGVEDTVSGTLAGALPSSYFHREYLYDALLRPWRVTTHIPAGTSGDNSWTEHSFTRESAYDYYYGRPKAMSYQGGEAIRLDYDSRGTPLGETQLETDGSVGITYRQVCGMSDRGHGVDPLRRRFDYVQFRPEPQLYAVRP